MHNKILIISKYFGYNVGGAERSTVSLMEKDPYNRLEISYIHFKNIKSFNANKYLMSMPSNWSLIEKELKYDFNHWKYFEYFLNKKEIKNIIKTLPTNYLIHTYGLYGPVIINSYLGPTEYFVRDEYGLGLNNNYYSGIKKIFKWIYTYIEYPFYLIWMKDLRKAIRKSDVLSNSNYIANEIFQKYGKHSKVYYPEVDEKILINEYNKIKNSVSIEDKGITIIGYTEIKGKAIVDEIIKAINSIQIRIYDRKFLSPIIKNNVHYLPWEHNVSIIYAKTNMLIVPSVCKEAYSRVVIEAEILKIPVIASNVGGITEAIGDKNRLVIDYKNIKAWLNKIHEYYRDI